MGKGKGRDGAIKWTRKRRVNEEAKKEERDTRENEAKGEEKENGRNKTLLFSLLYSPYF